MGITALSALTIGILLGVLISKKCLNPENGLCNRSTTEKPAWQSKKDHNCQFYIQSSKYLANDENLSELEVDISKRNETATSSNTASSKFQALQKHSTMSPYFIAQSIAFPKSRAISSTTSNNNIEIKDNTRSAAASSGTISTTSFCDISNLQDLHTTN